MMPSSAELSYFFEISKTLNFTRAAKILCISQPALTRAMQNLERNVGAELFIRHKNGVTLTRAGKKMLLHLKPLFECWKNATLEAVSSHNQVQGHIRIGCHSTIGLFIYGFMKGLIEKYPKLDIDIHTSTSTMISQRVIDLDIDIGIVSIPTKSPDLIMKKINETEYSLWVGKGNHPIQDIHSDNAVIICNPDYYLTQIILQKCKAANLNNKRILKVNSIEVIASLTANGCGIGILPLYFVKQLYADKMERVAKAPLITDSLYLIYRKDYVNVQIIKTVISAIRDSVKSHS